MRNTSPFAKLLKVIDDCMLEYNREINDSVNWMKLKRSLSNELSNFLGMDDFAIVCDDRVNTPKIVDENSLRCSITIYYDNGFQVFNRQLTPNGCGYYG